MRGVSTAHEMQLQLRHSSDSPQQQQQQHVQADPETPRSYSTEADPYKLSSSFKSPSELASIRSNTSRKRDGCGPVTFNKHATQARKLQKFYEAQNENIERLLTPVDEHVRVAREMQGDNQLKFKIAVHGSFAANLVLAVLQVYGAVSSVSLSLFTTMADALFDPLSNITLMVSNRAVKRVDPRRFPSGKARLETVGNIVFCFIMTAVSWILIVVSVIQLAEPEKEELNEFHLPATLAVSVAFCTKMFLFLYCWALRKQYSQVHILWEDHRNDLLINGFGLLTSVGGSILKWWIDPLGAILISLLISFLWIRTMISEFKLLVGVSADTETLQWITYLGRSMSPLDVHN